MPRLHVASILAAAAVAALAACGDATGPDGRLERAEVPDDLRAVVLPDTARAGVPFQVTVTARAGGCDEQVEPRVTPGASTVTIEPLVRVRSAAACTDVGKTFTYRLLVTLTRVGVGDVTVLGREVTQVRALHVVP